MKHWHDFASDATIPPESVAYALSGGYRLYQLAIWGCSGNLGGPVHLAFQPLISSVPINASALALPAWFDCMN